MRQIAVAAAVVLTGLGGCGRKPAPVASACSTVRPAQAALQARDEAVKDADSRQDPAAKVYAQTTYVDECVRRWAYRLAPSRDPVEDVAKAAVGGCWDDLALLNVNWSHVPNVGFSDALTGQPVTAERATYQGMFEKARFYAVQARAARCATPPD